MSESRSNDREERFAAVVDAVFEPLQRYLRRRASPEDASEVLNDTLLVLWRRLDAVPADDPLPWTYGVAKRNLANQQRGNGRRLRLVGRVHGEARAHRHDPTWTGDTDSALSIAVLELDESDQELIRLWAWEQLEPREIAVVLETTANAVSLRLNRVRKKLANSIERQDRPTAGHKVIGHREEHGS